MAMRMAQVPEPVSKDATLGKLPIRAFLYLMISASPFAALIATKIIKLSVLNIIIAVITVGIFTALALIKLPSENFMYQASISLDEVILNILRGRRKRSLYVKFDYIRNENRKEFN